MNYRHVQTGKTHGNTLFFGGIVVAALAAGFALWVGVLPKPSLYEGPEMLILVTGLIALQSILMTVFGLLRIMRGGSWTLVADEKTFQWQQPGGKKIVVAAQDIVSFDRVDDGGASISWYLNARQGPLGITS